MTRPLRGVEVDPWTGWRAQPRGLNDDGSRHAYPCRRVAPSLSPSPPPNSIPPGRGRVECDEVELGCPPGLSEPARDESGQPGSGDGLLSNGV